jgi:demethylmenaquinone methyltransferase / 2-methoxy-6-polyprenyl-1,4-benzoquinol methylase
MPRARPRKESPVRLADLDLEAHLGDPQLRQRFVTPMFDLIAPRYDRFTRAFSFGLDRRWKAELTAWVTATLLPEARILDLACGTGDLAFAAARRASRGEVIGVDASSSMIAIAQERAKVEAPAGNARFVLGDISTLEHEPASIDAVMAGYALRNVPDYERVIAEIARVLKPGGTLATLDFYRPESFVWRTLFLRYLSAAGNLVGWAWHREPVAYGYIARSIEHFVSWQRFSRALDEHGLTVERVRTKLLGGVALHFARRRGEDQRTHRRR